MEIFRNGESEGAPAAGERRESGTNGESRGLNGMNGSSRKEEEQDHSTPLKDLRQSLAEMQQRLAFLDEWEAGEGCLMKRMGEGGRSFLNQALQVAEENEGILPRSFDLESFRKDVDLARDAGALADELRELTNAVCSGEASIASQAFAKALIVVQAAKLGNAGGDLDDFLAKLAGN